MKKTILSIIYLLIVISAIGQDYTTLHNRYWYYRTRLRNDFMKVGTSQGCSIPMGQRGLGYEPLFDNYDFSDPNDGTDAQWGDAMGELGYYIGVLATEYRLLELNHQETDSVRYELYCALEALNRMDYYAEPYFTHAIANSTNPQTFPPSFDGFMLRDDVPIDFVQNNMKSFNYFGNKGFCSKVKIHTVYKSSGNGAQMQGETYYPPKITDPVGHYEKNYAGSYISQDNWINCLVGLALVRKFVPPGANYKNLSFMDGNGPDMNQEAFSIALRVMNYFKQDPTWNLKYPTGNFIGSDWGGIGTGLAFAHAEVLNKMDQNKWGHFVQPDHLSFDTWCQYNDWRKDGNVFEQLYKNVVVIPLMFINYNLTSHASGTLGNLFTANPAPYAGGEFTYKYLQLYQHSTNKPDVGVQICNLTAIGNCEYTFRGVNAKQKMQMHINAYQIWHPELLRVVLHGEGDCHTTDLNQSYYNAAVQLITDAPCEGPYNWILYDDMEFIINGQDSPPHWHTQTQLDHPESRDANGWTAEFNGIDYMLYHNLINIIDIEKNGLTGPKLMVDFGRRHIKTNYPANINGNMWGSPSYPAVVKAFEYIVADAGSVAANSNVSFWAGKEITIGSGFSIANPNDVAIGIQHFECGEIMSNPINPSVNARQGNNQNNQTVYPGLMATSYVKTDLISNTTETEGDQHYNPTLVHVDSLMAQTQKTLGNSLIAEIVPNPNTGFSKLYLTKPDLVRSIDVLDPLAKSLFTLNTISFSNDIDLSNLSKGLFSIVIKGVEGDVIVKKVIIQ